MIFVYPVGITLMFFVMLFRKRHILRNEELREQDPSVRIKWSGNNLLCLSCSPSTSSSAGYVHQLSLENVRATCLVVRSFWVREATIADRFAHLLWPRDSNTNSSSYSLCLNQHQSLQLLCPLRRGRGWHLGRGRTVQCAFYFILKFVDQGEVWHGWWMLRRF